MPLKVQRCSTSDRRGRSQAGAGGPHRQVAVGAGRPRAGAAQAMERRCAGGHREQAHVEERAAEEARRNGGRHRNVGLTAEQAPRRCRPAPTRSPRSGPRRLGPKRASAPEQPCWRVQHLGRPARSRPPSPPTACAPPAPGRRLAQQRQRPAVEHSPGGGQHRLAALDLEGAGRAAPRSSAPRSSRRLAFAGPRLLWATRPPPRDQ